MKGFSFYICTSIFMMISFALFSQEFELKMPDKDQIESARLTNERQYDIVYTYLTTNYKIASEKTNVKTFEFDDSQICAFEQTFEFDMRFTIRSCSEEGGATTTLEMPYVEKEKVMAWIERIYEIDETGANNKWYDDKNVFGPVDEGAGCYYEIKPKKDGWIVDMYCGC